MDDPVARSAKQDRLADGGTEPPAENPAEAPHSAPIGPVRPEDDGDITFGGGGLRDLDSLIAEKASNPKSNPVEPAAAPLKTFDEFEQTTLDDVVITEDPLDALDTAGENVPQSPAANLTMPSYPLSSSSPILPDSIEFDSLVY